MCDLVPEINFLEENVSHVLLLPCQYWPTGLTTVTLKLVADGSVIGPCHKGLKEVSIPQLILEWLLGIAMKLIAKAPVTQAQRTVRGKHGFPLLSDC